MTTAATRRARSVRGDPATTRERLIAAAAQLFNTAGYHGTDSNAIAREAGYAPATFYKHFADKRAIFLAVHESWVTAEWAAVERIVASNETAAVRARRLVKLTTELHRTWRGFRASLRALIAWDDEVRAFHRAQRRRQLRAMEKLRSSRSSGVTQGTAEANAVLLLTLERVCDALADGEIEALGLRARETTKLLADLVEHHIA